MTRYGATQDEWAHWDLVLGLTADLLPVVCEPGLPLSPSSVLKAYGKVPSRFDRAGRVVGFPGWTQHIATEAEIAAWSADPRLGICLQTRRVRALDVDITDGILAVRVRDTLDRWGLEQGVLFPARTRENSSKFLVLFALDGEHPKQILQTDGGPIEFLATGQQCLVAGCHPSGARYTWTRGGWSRGFPLIPTLSFDQFRELQTVLRDAVGQSDWSAGRLRKTRDAGAVAADSDDPVVRYLLATRRDLVLRVLPERVDVRCPWSESHTTGSDDTATSYFPAGTGGFETGHFRCLHAHCADRTTRDFLDAVGYLTDGFEALAGVDGDSVTALVGHEDLIGRDPLLPAVESPLEAPKFQWDHKRGKIKPLLPNVITALSRPDFCGAVLSRDDYKDQLIVAFPPASARPFTDEDYTELALRLLSHKFDPIPSQILRDAVSYVAKQHAFDSAIDWLTALPPWDGVPRVSGFCHVYLGAEDSAYSRAVSRYWWSAHAGRVLSPGIQADMAIVLISEQGTGKTSSIKAMVPSHEDYVELSLSDRDEDLSRSMRGKLIGELAELRGIASREMEAVKAWVSRQRESWVPKYMEFSRTFPRRLVLVGTSNQEEFLADETGNRRWLPIRVGDTQAREAIARDREQLWAEARVLFEQEGVCWQEAELLGRAEHYQFQIQDPWQATLERWLATPELDGVAPQDRPFLRTDDIFHEALHFEDRHAKPYEQQRIGKVLRVLGYRSCVIRQKGSNTRVWKR